MSFDNEHTAVANVDSNQSASGASRDGDRLPPPEAFTKPGEGAGSEPAPHGVRNGGRGVEKGTSSARRRAASQANGRKSRGPVTREGKQHSSQNARKPLERLLGLAEARTLHHQPGAALKLYRKLIAPYEPAPALLAQHFEDLARLYLELEACESVRDALLDHRAQQNTIEVRSRYREMDCELAIAPKEVFERGLHDLPDSPAKLKMQLECLAALKEKLVRREFEKIGPPLRQLYSNDLNPKSEDAQLVCIDCQRLMDPKESQSFSDEELHELVFLIEQQEQQAVLGYELELDKRTVTGAACMSRLAPRQEDQWLMAQEERLRRAIDRKQWVITGLLQTPSLAQRYGPQPQPETSESGAEGPSPRVVKNRKTNLRSHLESARRCKNEPKTNLNEPKRVTRKAR